MKHIKPGLIVGIGLLAFCLMPAGVQAGGIIGLVENIRNFGTDGWVVEVTSDTGNEITALSPDKYDLVKVDLKPGSYVLKPFYFPPQVPGRPTPNYVIEGPSTPVVVVGKRYTFVQLLVSFGPNQ